MSMPSGVLVEREVDEIYHVTTERNAEQIIRSGIIHGRPFVSLSSVPQMAFGEVVLALYEPFLRAQLVRVEYTAEWAEQNRKRAEYVVGGHGSWGETLRQFLDPLGTSFATEREWQSKGDKIVLGPSTLKKVFVNKSYAPWADILRTWAKDKNLIDPDNIFVMRGDGRIARAFKKSDKARRRSEWRVKHGVESIIKMEMSIAIHTDFVESMKLRRDVSDKTKAAAKNAKMDMRASDYIFSFDMPASELPVLVVLAHENIELANRLKHPWISSGFRKWLANYEKLAH